MFYFYLTPFIRNYYAWIFLLFANIVIMCFTYMYPIPFVQYLSVPTKWRWLITLLMHITKNAGIRLEFLAPWICILDKNINDFAKLVLFAFNNRPDHQYDQENLYTMKFEPKYWFSSFLLSLLVHAYYLRISLYQFRVVLFYFEW